jgi:hypothetical protein
MVLKRFGHRTDGAVGIVSNSAGFNRNIYHLVLPKTCRTGFIVPYYYGGFVEPCGEDAIGQLTGV